MTWALKRQIIYLLILTGFVSLFAFMILYPKLHTIPTCTDGKQNGQEEGVDCGTGCATVCPFQADVIKVIWTRSFKVVDGRYNAVAYLQNKNTNDAVYRVHYKFRFADKDNILINFREGDTYVPAGGNFVVFEPAIDTGNTVPVFTTIEFTQQPTWIKISPDVLKELSISTSNITLANEKTSPILSVLLKNNSLFQIPGVKVVAILYDKSGNAINASSTYLDTLDGGAFVPLTFTWPEPIVGDVVAKEVMPMFDIFSVKFN